MSKDNNPKAWEIYEEAEEQLFKDIAPCLCLERVESKQKLARKETGQFASHHHCRAKTENAAYTAGADLTESGALPLHLQAALGK